MIVQVRDRLLQLPQVDEVQVVRKLPGEIDLKIVERRPIAWITSDKQMSDPFASDAAFLVDARGVLMKEKKLLTEYLGLPLITGCTSESLEAGKTVESFEAKAALELLRLSTRSFMQTRFQIREIDVSKGYCLLVSDKNHTRVTFGFVSGVGRAFRGPRGRRIGGSLEHTAPLMPGSSGARPSRGKWNTNSWQSCRNRLLLIGL